MPSPETKKPATAERDASGSSRGRNTRVREVPWWGSVVIFLVSVLLKIWGRTLRFTGEGNSIEVGSATDTRFIFITWHNRLFVLPELQRRYRPGLPMTGLISASKDGAWLAALFRRMKIRYVRGSTSFRGREALNELRTALQLDTDVLITPDGPRGPCYSMKKSPATLAEVTGHPLMLLSLRFEKAWRLNSWDGFYLPRPFSSVEIRCRRHDSVKALHAAFPGLTTEDALKQAMEAITEDTPERRRPKA
ncbi:MAG: DUF374 domain-containing protein [Opitutales bacterium]